MNEDGLTVEIIDKVNGYCPACPCPLLKLEYESGIGSGHALFEVQRYVLMCEHQRVCKLRHEYAGEKNQ